MNDQKTLTKDEASKAKLAATLITRLKKRATSDGVVYTLDLRSKEFEAVESKRPTLYCPDDPEWPSGGRTTDDLDEAKRWVRERYTSWFWQKLEIARTAPDATTLTWREGAQRYVDSFKLVERGDDGTIVETIPASKRSRVSMIRRHIIPRFGHLPMASLDREVVGKEAEALKVRKSERPGMNVRVPSAHGTKINFKAALFAIWSYNFKYVNAPFAGVKIEAPKAEQGLSTEVFQFDDESGLGEDSTGALDPEQLRRALVAAMWYDQDRMRRPNLKNAMIPNTAHAMAMQAALGPRISELRNIRWGHINFKQFYVRIHNAKVHQVRVGQRATPLQLSLIPWLDELRTIEARLHPNGFVIRTDPGAPVTVPATQTSIAGRIATALELAGLKRQGKETHGLRATYASILDQSDEISDKMVRRYLGHQAIYGCSTDKYVRQLISMMQEAHRHLIKLPTPEEVRAELANFTPVPVKNWKERKKPWPRSKQAKEKRKQMPKRVPLGASLDFPAALRDEE